MILHFHTFSRKETIALGANLARSLPYQRRKATIITLSGDLGAGKTTFIQGLLKALGVRGRVVSPTFTLMRRLKLGNSKIKNVYHLDCYRLRSKEDLNLLGIPGIEKDNSNLILVEWPECVKGAFGKPDLRLTLKHGKKENERLISLRSPDTLITKF